MNRHPIRWESLTFGLLFLAAVAAWRLWNVDLLAPRQFAYAGAGALIVLGVLGIVASVARPRTRPTTPTTQEASDDAQDTDPHDV